LFLKNNFSIKDSISLEVKSVFKKYGLKPILHGVSLKVNSGEAVAILGPNGAGKTTLFSIITGLIKADSGTVYLNNQDVSSFPLYKRARLGVGYLPQESSIFRGMTVEQNLMSIIEMFVKNHDDQEKMLERLLSEFAVSHLRRSSALSLSGGERRRVEIARALASSPKFLLLDEPLAGIDPIAVGEIRDLILQLKNIGLGVLITDHNVRETLDIVDRAYIVAGGKILMEGNPSEIVENQDVRRMYLGEGFSLYGQ